MLKGYVFILLLSAICALNQNISCMERTEKFEREENIMNAVIDQWKNRDDEVNAILWKAVLEHPNSFLYFREKELIGIFSFQNRNVILYIGSGAEKTHILLPYDAFLAVAGKEPEREYEYTVLGIVPFLASPTLPAKDIESHLKKLMIGKKECFQCAKTDCKQSCPHCSRAYYCDDNCQLLNHQLHKLICTYASQGLFNAARRVSFYVGELNKAIEFYQKIGFRLDFKILEGPGALFSTGDDEKSGLSIKETKTVEPSKLSLKVQSAMTVQQKVAGQGILGKMHQTPQGLTFEIKDDWNNTIEFADNSKTEPSQKVQKT